MASHNRPPSWFPGSGEEPTVNPSSKESTPFRSDDKTLVLVPTNPARRAYHKNRRERILPVNPSTSYTSEPVTILEGRPWDHYRMAYSLELGGSVAVVQRQPATKELFTVRSFSGPSAGDKLSFLRQLQHDNVLLSHQIFSFEEVFYVVSECMAISLEELAIARPDEPQLATIIHQILEGISFFISHNVTHGAITCSNILLSSKGEVKIANPELCHTSTQSGNSEDILALGRVMKLLMESGTDDGTLSLQWPNLWSDEAVNFLPMTMSASSKQLADHPFLKATPRTEELVRLVSLAQVSACRFYKYKKV